MKRNLMIIAGCMAMLAYTNAAYAQTTALLPDQNPRYQETRAKYIEMADSLNRNQGTTVQNTYKAYDWYTAREERRALRRTRNHEYRMAYGDSYWYPSVGYSVGLGLGLGFGNYGYGNYGYGGWGSRHWGRGWGRW